MQEPATLDENPYGKEIKMSVEEKYQAIAEKIQELDDLISDSDVELQSVWDTWVTRLAGEHAYSFHGLGP